MTATSTYSETLAGLNEQQAEAVLHGAGPLLIVAGAGTGKTKTLVHRVARQIELGTDPSRILLLTFTRRAAAEMLRRVDVLLQQMGRSASRKSFTAGKKVWGGTFHATATRLLRLYGKSIGLQPSFTIHDRADSADLLNVVRTDLGLTKADKRFPKKGTCMAIYSHAVSAQRPLEQVLKDSYPWCEESADDLKRLFQGYTDRKEDASVLDYDDLLLFWHGLLADPRAGEKVRERFDCVFVDEYQDTNKLQAEILRMLRPGGTGFTVVGDDAQSIYSFRAATVRNILDFPKEYPGTTVLKLEQNYRSTQPILDVTNGVISQSKERYAKELWTGRKVGEKPKLVTCEDDNEQAEYVVEQILELREAGTDLQRQAVLFRASHHSLMLEAELVRHNIPFVKYGGLRFIETAHVKDLMALLRLAENPRDIVSGSRALMLLPGIGPKKARQFMELLAAGTAGFDAWTSAKVPAATGEYWPKLIRLMKRLERMGDTEVQSQVRSVRKFYKPLLEKSYDHVEPRVRDLEQLEQLSVRYKNRATMLAEITLDPPATAEDFAGDPLLDEDFLILSTIHSAKGLEWDAVTVLHAADGNIPSDMATGSATQIEEERRLFYVALTRAKNHLTICFPQRYYHAARGSFSDSYGYAQLTRFLPPEVKGDLEQCAAAMRIDDEEPLSGPVSLGKNIRGRVRGLWT